MNSLLTIYVNDEPYTVDGTPMAGSEVAMLAHDEHYDEYVVYLDGLDAVPTHIAPDELVQLCDQDRFTTARKEG